MHEGPDASSKPLVSSFSFLKHVRYEHFVAGISGGTIATLLLHPLDLVKIRFQVNEGHATGANRPQYKGIIDAVRKIVRNDTVLGLYRGVIPNVWGAGASWGFYFFFYNTVKTWMQDGNATTVLSPGHHMLAAAQAGFVTLVITNPIWVVKTRLCLQYDKPLQSLNTKHTYRGMFDALIKIGRYEGIRGLYKGFLPGVFGISHGTIQFVVYEEMKNKYNIHYNRSVDYRLGTIEYLLFAATSKIIAASLTYPYQVVRSRLQDQHRNYKGNLDIIRQTWKYESFPGFYKGFGIYLLHVLPNICIVFPIHEHITSWIFKKDSMTSCPPAKTSSKWDLGDDTNSLKRKEQPVKDILFQNQDEIDIIPGEIADDITDPGGLYRPGATSLKQQFEGWRGFFKGLAPSLIRVTPACCITFVVYESIISYLIPNTDNR